MKNSLSSKLRFLFIAIIFIFAGFSWFSVDRLSELNSKTASIVAMSLPRIQAIGTLTRDLKQYRIFEARMIIAANAADMSDLDVSIRKQQAVIADHLQAYERLGRSSEDTAAVKALDGEWTAYVAANAAMLDLARQNKDAEAAQLFNQGKTRFDGITAAMTTLADADDAQAKAAGAAAADTFWVVRAIMGGLSLVILAAALAGALYFDVAVCRVIGRLTEQTKRLAAGQFDTDIEGRARGDEIGDLARAVQIFKDSGLEKLQLEAMSGRQREEAEAERRHNEASRSDLAKEQETVVETIARGLGRLSGGQLTFRIEQAFAPAYEKLRVDFNGAMEKLQGTMAVVSTNTSAIRSGTDEIRSASDDLSRRTEQQAASLEETAAALDEITATVRKTAEGSKHARDVVGQAKQAAEQSGQVVRQAVDAMSRIEKSAGQIGNIIGVIDEIAFQTNLLALNAGVEAARAGDAGRGFAVVASEVRALAQRSADAAKEIKALISASSQQVEIGVDLVGQTGHSLEKIVVQVTEINAIVADIAASALEQTTGLEQVNTAVNQMDQVTQQNAAMVEESTAASHALARETEELARLIAQFDIGQNGAATSSRKAPAAAPKPSLSAKLVTALKPSARGGGAARKPSADMKTDDWREF